MFAVDNRRLCVFCRCTMDMYEATGQWFAFFFPPGAKAEDEPSVIIRQVETEEETLTGGKARPEWEYDL